MPEPVRPTGAARLLRLFRVDPSEIGFFACLVGPIVVTVILNALVRPAIAQALGGIRHSPGSGVRSRDVYWEFDAATQAAHPFLTSFLEASDGLMAVCAVGVIVVLFLGRWVLRRLRRASPSRQEPGPDRQEPRPNRQEPGPDRQKRVR